MLSDACVSGAMAPVATCHLGATSATENYPDDGKLLWPRWRPNYVCIFGSPMLSFEFTRTIFFVLFICSGGVGSVRAMRLVEMCLEMLPSQSRFSFVFLWIPYCCVVWS